jgi:DNA-binding PadR family transcriptional regulator
LGEREGDDQDGRNAARPRRRHAIGLSSSLTYVMLDDVYLDIVILGHLRHAPMHGYELKRKVSATTAFPLHNNTLYPALRRFEEAGAVSKTAVQQEGRPPRHVYELTDVGSELLHDMLAELPPELAGVDEEFLTRVGMFNELTVAERRGVLAARDHALQERLQHLKELSERSQGSAAHRTWGQQVTTELIDRVDHERAWIGRLTTMITKR